MQAIKCELCGSNQLIKKEGYFQCEHCGTKYTLEEAKKLIVSGTVEVVKGNAEKERLLSNANCFLELKEFKKATNLFEKIIKEYPNDYRGWLGSFQAYFTEAIDSEQPINISHQLFFNAEKLCDNKNVIIDFINYIIKLHGSKLRIIRDRSKSNYFPGDIKAYDENLDKLDVLVADNFSIWLIYELPLLINNLPYLSNIISYIQSLTQEYVTKVKNGFICPYISQKGFYYYEFPKPPLYNDCWNLTLDHKQLSKIDHGDIYHHFVNALVTKLRDEYYVTNGIYGIKISKNKNSYVEGFPSDAVGCWIYFSANYYGSISHCLLKLPYTITLSKLGLCKHCGGNFKGVFTKTCSKCGKPKDY